MDASLAALVWLRQIIELSTRAGPSQYRHDPHFRDAIDACVALIKEREDRLTVAMRNAMNAQIEGLR